MADIDELLKLLDEKIDKLEADKTASKPINESTERFIKTCNIKNGVDRISNDIIYYTYQKKYVASMGEEKWSKVHFFRLFNKHFNQVRTGKQRYYLLDGDSFDLTREGRIEAESYNKEYHYQVGLKTGKIKRRKRRKQYNPDEER
jgi:hypothetical protein